MQYSPKVGVKIKPAATMLFFKPAKSVVGPEDAIILPEYTRGMDNDYEVSFTSLLKLVKSIRLLTWKFTFAHTFFLFRA